MKTQSNKVVMIGPSGVGKTSLLDRINRNEFNDYAFSTVGVSYETHDIIVDNRRLRLHIWDTTGQDKFKFLLPSFIKGARVVLLCFDEPNVSEIQNRIVDIESLEPNIKIIIVLTKIDINCNKLDIYQPVLEYAEYKNLELFFTSSLTGKGVKELFEDIGRYFLTFRDSKIDEKIIDIGKSADNIINNEKSCCTIF